MTPPPKPKRNKRLKETSKHVGGSMVERETSLFDGPKLNRHGLSITDL